MTLSEIKTIKTVSGRKKILQQFLRENPLGDLQDEENKILLWLFDTFYTPDEGQQKYELDEIDRFSIGRDTLYNNPCFRMKLKNGSDDVATLRRLAGENRTEIQNLHRALRYAIQPQIDEFRLLNPLRVLDTCPIENCPLGSDAQVDHYNPTFHELVKEWLNTHPTAKAEYESPMYRLKNPSDQKSWIQFHKERANLRWLSKQGNAKAHRNPKI